MAIFTPNPVLAQISQNRDNSTALNVVLAPPWVDDIGFRGTSGLVVSCVGTLLACVYTALHLNVLRKSGLCAIVRAKAKWVAIALMAPELVLYMAAQQFVVARALVRELNVYKRERLGNDDDFTLGYAFFVIMGGLHVDVSRFLSENSRRYQAYDQPVFPEGDPVPERLAITPQGLVQLAKHGHFLRVSLATIEDKSKSDTVQKFLVVGQLGWMVAQCITRSVFGLPLCLLEIHTAVHAVCALFLYLFWFKKPLDINDPEVIRADGLEYIISFMIQEQFYELQSLQLMVYPTWTAETARMYPKALSTQVRNPGEFTYQMMDDGQYAAVEFLDGGWGEITLRPGQALKCGIGFIKRENNDDDGDMANDAQTEKPTEPRDRTAGAETGEASASASGPTAHADPDHDTLLVDFADQERWKYMIDFLCARHGRSPTHPYLFHASPGPRYPTAHYHAGFTAHPGNFFGGSTSSSYSSPGGPFFLGGSGGDMWDMLAYVRAHPLLLALLLVLPALYGGIHLAGWDLEFPSGAERACWRAACLLIVAAFPALLALAHACAAAEAWVLARGSGLRALDCVARARNAAWYGVLGAYALARLFIVVEAFISLRRVPIGVFWMPAWLDMVPHL
ncbi:hypothetical protein F4809DRAFT_637408 [Biscogniauxia mediterranea]|nr:hypothetical protein F4809DRAFT_637408 [Biscogniauxia mediterranea]